jgi:hypothetical protein
LSLCSETDCPKILTSIDGVDEFEGNGWHFHGLRDAWAIFTLGSANREYHDRTSIHEAEWIDSIRIVSGSPDREDLRMTSFRLWSSEIRDPSFPASWYGEGSTLPTA